MLIKSNKAGEKFIWSPDLNLAWLNLDNVWMWTKQSTPGILLSFGQNIYLQGARTGIFWSKYFVLGVVLAWLGYGPNKVSAGSNSPPPPFCLTWLAPLPPVFNLFRSGNSCNNKKIKIKENHSIFFDFACFDLNLGHSFSKFSKICGLFGKWFDLGKITFCGFDAAWHLINLWLRWHRELEASCFRENGIKTFSQHRRRQNGSFLKYFNRLLQALFEVLLFLTACKSRFIKNSLLGFFSISGFALGLNSWLTLWGSESPGGGLLRPTHHHSDEPYYATTGLLRPTHHHSDAIFDAFKGTFIGYCETSSPY